MEFIPMIFPIFVVIFIGWLTCQAGFFPQSFVGSANRLVYFIAIPALLFRSIAESSFRTFFNLPLLLATLGAMVGLFLLLLIVTGRGFRVLGVHRGSFIQGSIHGNLGYIGLAVAYYALGEKQLTHAGVLAGFVMIVHNVLSVVALSMFTPDHASSDRRYRKLLGRIARNPVILSCMAGIAYSFAGWPVHPVADRVLNILGGMALPMALLLIGATLSFKGFSEHFSALVNVTALKLIALPALGFLLYRLAGLSPDIFLPGLILLAAPTATVAYVMALEMKGQPEFAVSVISVTTLASLVSYTFWLSFAQAAG